IAEAPDMRVAELKRFLRRTETKLAIELERCLCAMGAGNHQGLAYCLRFLRQVEEERQRGFESLNMQVPIDGTDLQALGIPPGPHYRDLLGSVEDALLEGIIADRDEALELVRQLWHHDGEDTAAEAPR